jgi:hypothetical protein
LRLGVWHYLAYIGNYEALCKAIDEKKYDQSIKNKYGATIWYYLAHSSNYEDLCKAHIKYKFDIDIIPRNYRHLIPRKKLKSNFSLKKKANNC